MPLISVIIPCYNLEHWIRDCLDSVLSQSHSDWECVVVDDESKDGSPAILDEYSSMDARIRVIHQKNAGEGGARNAGLAIAQGEWVFFLDGDDVMAPGALELLSNIIAHYPTHYLIRFGFEDFDDGTPFPIVRHTGRVQGPIDISRQITYEDYCVYVWQFLFRRTMIAGMMFDHYKRGADRTFIVPVLCFKADSFLATEDVCYFYRKRQGSAVNSMASVQVLKDELSHRADVIEAIDKSGKIMPYRRTEWLEGYCTREYQRLVRQYRPDEQRELVAWFYHELPRLRIAKDYSWRARTNCMLYNVFRSQLAWRLISYVVPVALYRTRVALTSPVRAFRAAVRHFRQPA